MPLPDLDDDRELGDGDDDEERHEGECGHPFAGYYGPRMPTVDEVEEALTNVIDPELGLDFVELGLVYEIEVDEGEVSVTFTLTSPGCPIGPQVADQMREYVGDLEGVEQVSTNMVFTPPWSPDRMSEDAKFALGY